MIDRKIVPQRGIILYAFKEKVDSHVMKSNIMVSYYNMRFVDAGKHLIESLNIVCILFLICPFAFIKDISYNEKIKSKETTVNSLFLVICTKKENYIWRVK